MWLYLTIIAIIAGSISAVTNKQLSGKGHSPLQISYATSILTGLVIFLIAFKQISQFNPSLFFTSWIIVVVVLLGILGRFFGGILYSKGIKTTDLSIAGTLENVRPFFALTAAYFLMHESITIKTIFGVFLILIGLSILNFKKNPNKQYSNPIKKIKNIDFQNSGAFYIVSAIFIGAMLGVMTKSVLNTDIPPLVFATINTLGVSFFAYNTRRVKKETSNSIFKEKYLYLRVFLLVIAIICMLYAYKLGDISKIEPLVITRSLVLSFIGILIFKEGEVLKKSLAAAVTLSGAVFVVIG